MKGRAGTATRFGHVLPGAARLAKVYSPGKKGAIMKKLEANPVIREKTTKTELAVSLGISRQALYYKPKMPLKDSALKLEIEKVLAKHPAYGHKRVAMELKINKTHQAGDEEV